MNATFDELMTKYSRAPIVVDNGLVDKVFSSNSASSRISSDINELNEELFKKKLVFERSEKALGIELNAFPNRSKLSECIGVMEDYLSKLETSLKKSDKIESRYPEIDLDFLSYTCKTPVSYSNPNIKCLLHLPRFAAYNIRNSEEVVDIELKYKPDYQYIEKEHSIPNNAFKRFFGLPEKKIMREEKEYLPIDVKSKIVGTFHNYGLIVSDIKITDIGREFKSEISYKSDYVGLLPEPTLNKIEQAQNMHIFDSIYVVAESKWKLSPSKSYDACPLVIGTCEFYSRMDNYERIYSPKKFMKAYLIDTFDTTTLENYVVETFSSRKSGQN